MNRITPPTDHPRSRQRLNRAIKSFVQSMRASDETDPDPRPPFCSDEKYVVGTLKILVGGLLRDRPPAAPVRPEAVALRAAMYELGRALTARARAVRGFDDYEAEWIIGEARKAVEAR